MYNYKLKNIAILLLISFGVMVSCKKYLPDDSDTITNDTQFTQTVYTPVLGRTTLMTNNFYSGNSTIPFTFKIINPRVYNDGSVAQVLKDTFPVSVWKTEYSGNETSLAQIDSERAIEYHPAFELREHAGDFVMWSAALSPYFLSQPDSGYVFDVEATNSGGRVYYRNFRLMPYKERPFEPSNLNAITGQATTAFVNPTIVSNVDGTKTSQPLSGNGINIYFFKVADTGRSLTFKFFDTLYNPIDPHKFNDTDWKNLVHGFNMNMTSDKVQYDVAYPIPLSSIITKYTTSDGSRASVSFKYHRLSFGNIRKDALIRFDFGIFEQGAWQIIFWFKSDNPKFEDD